jgi:hypothetical protein
MHFCDAISYEKTSSHFVVMLISSFWLSLVPPYLIMLIVCSENLDFSYGVLWMDVRSKMWTYFADKSTNNLVWSCHFFLTVTSAHCHLSATASHGRWLPSSRDHKRVGHMARGSAHQPLNGGWWMEATQESRLKRRSLLTFSPKRHNFPGKASNST